MNNYMSSFFIALHICIISDLKKKYLHLGIYTVEIYFVVHRYISITDWFSRSFAESFGFTECIVHRFVLYNVQNRMYCAGFVMYNSVYSAGVRTIKCTKSRMMGRGEFYVICNTHCTGDKYIKYNINSIV